jgi:hypothetical protein
MALKAHRLNEEDAPEAIKGSGEPASHARKGGAPKSQPVILEVAKVPCSALERLDFGVESAPLRLCAQRRQAGAAGVIREPVDTFRGAV